MDRKLCKTEERNERTGNIDELSTIDMIRLINDEDKKVALAVEREAEHIAAAVDVIAGQLKAGGRLIYCGCGTSGRLGVLDAVECPPTYSTDPDMVVGLIAGGYDAMFRAVEGAEDDRALGEKDLRDIRFGREDVLVGIAASGRTPYVLGAMAYARSLGAPVVSVTCCPGSPVTEAADIAIAPAPGPEVVTGSTRMKSGTAQKMVLNMLSTCAMVKLGKVYGNLMVDLRASNHKLVDRAQRLIIHATGVDRDRAKALLEEAGGHVKLAILLEKSGLEAAKAKALLDRHGGHLAQAIENAREEH